MSETMAVAWIEEERRIWGIDRDHLRGWHRHPLGNPENHQAMSALTISEIIQELAQAWKQDR